MRIVIIEDERITANDLAETIKLADPTAEIQAILRSVSEGLAWFKDHVEPDLIFSDIQLGDGLSFEILNNLRTPVIFCTAFDEYALTAFRANGIEYLLKPFSTSSVSAALQKFRELTQGRQDMLSRQYEMIRGLLTETKTPKVSHLLINYRDTVMPLKIDDIALFFVESEVVRVLTFDQKTHYPGKTLEELESMVGNDFFRANRQFLVSRKTIVNASSILSRKLSLTVSVPINDTITISKERSTAFFKWLSGIQISTSVLYGILAVNSIFN
ncbi:LytR/AlgR family response regulator transcription factor [Dyadobacter crusticola]|uniref:LytR/AlgR family response regulator transcription factor n=1 Tax=Dyadobacter crusticola TaxID=292407 RepID=UPI00068BC796|nr:LytTR family DNA-binding domain-containing protein [Dyadobacter crusticola]